MKFRVFPLGIFFIVIYDLLASIAFGLVMIESSKELWLVIMSIIMFVALPALISIYLLFYSLDLIIISENGIEKYHFGKLKKKFHGIM